MSISTYRQPRIPVGTVGPTQGLSRGSCSASQSKQWERLQPRRITPAGLRPCARRDMPVQSATKQGDQTAERPRFPAAVPPCSAQASPRCWQLMCKRTVREKGDTQLPFTCVTACSLAGGNLRPLVTKTPLPHANEVYGQLLGRDFNPLDLLLLLRTVRVTPRPGPIRARRRRRRASPHAGGYARWPRPPSPVSRAVWRAGARPRSQSSGWICGGRCASP